MPQKYTERSTIKNIKLQIEQNHQPKLNLKENKNIQKKNTITFELI